MHIKKKKDAISLYSVIYTQSYSQLQHKLSPQKRPKCYLKSHGRKSEVVNVKRTFPLLTLVSLCRIQPLQESSSIMALLRQSWLRKALSSL